jgi:hypothetical protein
VRILIEKSPHNQIVRDFPIIGIEEIKLVITVAAQKDIWPQGSTYPMKAVAMRMSRMRTPEFQV